jgi:Zn finger protein HypA/HybF involved in hydrogenase expression
LSRPMLRFHASSPNCPDEFKGAADWERRIKHPNGYVCDEDGRIELYLDQSSVPEGIRPSNSWRRPVAGGRGPSLERKLRHLLKRFGGSDPSEEQMEALLELLSGGPRFIVPVKLFGFRRARTLLQVNADNVLLELLDETSRYKCSVCKERVPWATDGLPCPSCHGIMVRVPEAELRANRYVLRIRRPQFRPLVAGEHTAQVTGAARIELEQAFKAIPERSPVNVLACSPTLEMGIDVGGLDAVVMRNIPPRPDNYAQRGGRSGRRTRVGVVVGYARRTPHDGYFFDKPREMIAGEVPAPSVGLTNRDVLRRHLNAILFGTTNPPLAGRMSEYLNNQGALKPEAIEALLAGLTSHIPGASATAWEAFGPPLMAQAGLESVEDLKSEYQQLPGAIEDLLDRTRLQIIRLRDAISRWNELLQGGRQALQAASLINRLLGISDRDASQGAEADDRSAGHPMRQFAEFGILPGYEFPNEPCTLRLLGDDNEDETVAVERRFGIGQYQPGAPVHAGGHRWRVVGLNLASPWNPKTTEPSWIYAKCADCELRYDAQEPKCPRCGSTQLGCPDSGLAGYEFGGFVAVRSDSPVLEEEDRYAAGSLVFCHPQHDGQVLARYRLSNGWRLQLRTGEEVRWVNEWRPPSEADKGRPQLLSGERRGFYVCPSCGRDLVVPDGGNTGSRGRQRASRGDHADPFGHAQGCDRKGQPLIRRHRSGPP